MIHYLDARIQELSIHYIGNKLISEPCSFSEAPVSIEGQTLPGLLIQYFLAPFAKENEVFRLQHSFGDLNLNEVYHFAETIFESADFHKSSTQLARHLYDVSMHPKIKGGELYVVRFNEVQLEGETVDAIGIFKSENKEAYLKVNREERGFNVSYEEEAINIRKLEKGCLIFNTDKELGYKVMTIDKVNRSTETVYWVDEFLNVAVRNDSFNKTQNALSVYKSFVTDKMDEEFEISRPEKIDLLNRSIKYFKEKDTFDIDEFSNEVIGNPEGIESFKKFKKSYEEEYETSITDSFSISGAAVKKQARVFKSVLKLDKNFHIYIHGNKDLIEKGFDQQKGMGYYKIYFKEEQ